MINWLIDHLIDRLFNYWFMIVEGDWEWCLRTFVDVRDFFTQKFTEDTEVIRFYERYPLLMWFDSVLSVHFCERYLHTEVHRSHRSNSINRQLIYDRIQNLSKCLSSPFIKIHFKKNPAAQKDVSPLVPVSKENVDAFAKNWDRWLPKWKVKG